jgi:hypothetical protein
MRRKGGIEADILFVGRSAELGRLDDWGRSSNPVMIVEGIGGLGKSMVAWEWFDARRRHDHRARRALLVGLLREHVGRRLRPPRAGQAGVAPAHAGSFAAGLAKCRQLPSTAPLATGRRALRWAG